MEVIPQSDLTRGKMCHEFACVSSYRMRAGYRARLAPAWATIHTTLQHSSWQPDTQGRKILARPCKRAAILPYPCVLGAYLGGEVPSERKVSTVNFRR